MKEFLFIILVLSAFAWHITSSYPVKTPKLNNQPIIAVLAQHHPKTSNHSYIAASYVKYLESSGARVVPIPHRFSAHKVAELFKYVNGLFLPGGDVDLFTSDYYKHAKQLWDLALAANDKGDYFPVWGTCMGFEVLHVLRQGQDILSQRISSDKSLPLKYTKSAKTSRLFKHAPKSLFDMIGREKVTWNHHHFGVTPEMYEKHARLKSFFKILSLNKDQYGKIFVSTVEAFKYPIYGIQWHPEKNNFEFTTKYNELPHSAHAVMTSQYMANFFVNECRHNHHKFPSKKLQDKYLIYNYKPTRSSVTKSLTAFEQVYYF